MSFSNLLDLEIFPTIFEIINHYTSNKQAEEKKERKSTKICGYWPRRCP